MSLGRNTKTITGNYTIYNTDQVLNVDVTGVAIELTLPEISSGDFGEGNIYDDI